MSEFKNYFDGIDTTANMAAECGEIRSKAAKIRKRRKIATSSLGVTLAVMMTTTVAASAAGGWNITQIIGRWFSGNTETIENNIAEVTAEKTENKFEFLDISTNGSIIDDNMIIFFVDVTRNDGNIFDCEEHVMKKEDGSIFYTSDGETFPDTPWYNFDLNELKFVLNVTESDGYNYDTALDVASRQFLVDDGNPTDNKMTIAFCCDRRSIVRQMSEDKKMIIGSETVGAGDLNSYTVKSVELKLGALYDRRDFVAYQDEATGIAHIKGSCTERISGNWEGELLFDIKPAKTVSIKPNKASTFKVHPGGESIEEYDQSFNVERITLSQMSVSFEMSAEAPEQDRFIETYRIGEIIMKNGDTVAIQPYTLVPCLYHESGNLNEHLPPEQHSAKWQVGGSVMLTEPIDPDDVKAVRLGDTTFPVK